MSRDDQWISEAARDYDAAAAEETYRKQQQAAVRRILERKRSIAHWAFRKGSTDSGSSPAGAIAHPPRRPKRG